MKNTVSTAGDALLLDRRGGEQISAKLVRLHELPDSALLTADEAALYLNARRDLLRAWRWRGQGPGFVGRGHFIRYPKGQLDQFIAGYSRRQPSAGPATTRDDPYTTRVP